MVLQESASGRGCVLWVKHSSLRQSSCPGKILFNHYLIIITCNGLNHYFMGYKLCLNDITLTSLLLQLLKWGKGDWSRDSVIIKGDITVLQVKVHNKTIWASQCCNTLNKVIKNVFYVRLHPFGSDGFVWTTQNNWKVYLKIKHWRPFQAFDVKNSKCVIIDVQTLMNMVLIKKKKNKATSIWCHNETSYFYSLMFKN